MYDSPQPAYRISQFHHALGPLVWVAPTAPVAQALTLTLMMLEDYSQLPVMATPREIKGVISWKSVGARMTLGQVPVTFDRVLMDSWYGAKALLLFIESLGKFYDVPLKCNRQVDDSGGVSKYKRVDDLSSNSSDLTLGQTIKLKEFPKEHKVKLFRIVVSGSRTDLLITNDLTQNSTNATQDACAIRWEIEQIHRELKQLTGVEKCQCRTAPIQRNHIACDVLVWIRLAELARKSMKTIYQIKHEMLSNYLRRELRSPAARFAVA